MKRGLFLLVVVMVVILLYTYPASAELIGTGEGPIAITGGPFLNIASPVDFTWGIGLNPSQHILSTVLDGNEGGTVFHFASGDTLFNGLETFFETIHDHPEVSIPIENFLWESHGWFWDTGEYVIGWGGGTPGHTFWKPGSENYVIDGVDFIIQNDNVSPSLFLINYRWDIYGDPAPVPEPTTMLLLGLGLIGLAGVRKKFRK